MRELGLIASTYAVRGNSELRAPPYMELTRDTGVEWVLNDSVDMNVHGTPVSLHGVDAGAESVLLRMGGEVRPNRLSIALYHYPDFAPLIGVLPFDLMLSGHTHGGQIRLPWVGALISSSRAGTKFARGLFQQNGRSIFVSQGVGSESYGLPRMRFLCPPEVALIELSRS